MALVLADRRVAFSKGAHIQEGALLRGFTVPCFRFSVVGELRRFLPQTQSFLLVYSLARFFFSLVLSCRESLEQVRQWKNDTAITEPEI